VTKIVEDCRSTQKLLIMFRNVRMFCKKERPSLHITCMLLIVVRQMTAVSLNLPERSSQSAIECFEVHFHLEKQ
jgi:hypothetical protein